MDQQISTADLLNSCRREIALLKEENRILRESAQSFSDLAERLQITLDAERKRSRALSSNTQTDLSRDGARMASH
jgi:hypothetical protein